MTLHLPKNARDNNGIRAAQKARNDREVLRVLREDPLASHKQIEYGIGVGHSGVAYAMLARRKTGKQSNVQQ